MDDNTPLLMATPLYGTAEPETVTFDESAIPTVIAANAVTIGPVTGNRSHRDNSNGWYQGEGDALWPLRATPSVDYSAAQSDKPEEPVFRDVVFSVLFWIQFIAMIVAGFTIAPEGYDMVDIAFIKQKIEEDPTTTSSDLQDFETFVSFLASYVQVYPERIFTYLLVPMFLVAFLIALVVTTKIIKPHPKAMVTFCLVGAFVDMAIIMIMMVINSRSFGGLIITGIILSVVAYYILSAWRLIPYSAVNLGVSLEGVHSNCGIYIVALVLSLLAFLWTFYWGYVLVGTMIYVGETQCPGQSDDDDDCGPQGWTFLAMLLSFYWTSQVISVSLSGFLDHHDKFNSASLCFPVLFVNANTEYDSSNRSRSHGNLVL